MIGHPASEEVIIDYQVNNTHSTKKLLIRFCSNTFHPQGLYSEIIDRDVSYASQAGGMKVNYHGVQPPAKGTVVTRDWHLKRVDNSFVNKTFWKMDLIRGQSKTVILTITRNSSQKARDGVFWRKTARDLWLLKFLRMLIDLAIFLEVQWRE